ncbi:MAG: hypothetical protein IPJ88_18100 [Myxococcales bacterium]|nr:MAG: hypothetical protein IPJ88_18100 [Myxococcales bacterium]
MTSRCSFRPTLAAVIALFTGSMALSCSLDASTTIDSDSHAFQEANVDQCNMVFPSAENSTANVGPIRLDLHTLSISRLDIGESKELNLYYSGTSCDFPPLSSNYCESNGAAVINPEAATTNFNIPWPLSEQGTAASIQQRSLSTLSLLQPQATGNNKRGPEGSLLIDGVDFGAPWQADGQTHIPAWNLDAYAAYQFTPANVIPPQDSGDQFFAVAIDYNKAPPYSAQINDTLTQRLGYYGFRFKNTQSGMYIQPTGERQPAFEAFSAKAQAHFKELYDSKSPVQNLLSNVFGIEMGSNLELMSLPNEVWALSSASFDASYWLLARRSIGCRIRYEQVLDSIRIEIPFRFMHNGSTYNVAAIYKYARAPYNAQQSHHDDFAELAMNLFELDLQGNFGQPPVYGVDVRPYFPRQGDNALLNEADIPVIAPTSTPFTSSVPEGPSQSFPNCQGQNWCVMPDHHVLPSCGYLGAQLFGWKLLIAKPASQTPLTPLNESTDFNANLSLDQARQLSSNFMAEPTPTQTQLDNWFEMHGWRLFCNSACNGAGDCFELSQTPQEQNFNWDKKGYPGPSPYSQTWDCPNGCYLYRPE